MYSGEIRCLCKASFEKLFRFFLIRLEEFEKGEDKLICMISKRMWISVRKSWESPRKCVFLNIVLFLNQ